MRASTSPPSLASQPDRATRLRRCALPVATGSLLFVAWWIGFAADVFPTGTVPSPADVASAFATEARSGRLFEDAIASLYRVAWGFRAHPTARPRIVPTAQSN